MSLSLGNSLTQLAPLVCDWISILLSLVSNVVTYHVRIEITGARHLCVKKQVLMSLSREGGTPSLVLIVIAVWADRIDGKDEWLRGLSRMINPSQGLLGQKIRRIFSRLRLGLLLDVLERWGVITICAHGSNVNVIPG